MTSNNEDSGIGARVLWALLTPVLLLVATISVFGILLIPAICIYMDGRSRTYTGAITVLAVCTIVSVSLGAQAASICAFVAIATLAAYVLTRVHLPFHYGVLSAAGGGVVGAVVLLAILSSSLGKPISEAAAAGVCNTLTSTANTWYLNFTVTYMKVLEQPDVYGFQSLVNIPKDILNLSISDKIGIIKPNFELAFAQEIPSCALVGGMLAGALGYYLPMLSADRRKTRGATSEPHESFVPPFSSFKFPKYIIVSILLLEIVMQFLIMGGNIGFAAISVAANSVLTLLMTVQALALFSFFMNRKRMPGALQALILVPGGLLFFWLLQWVGLFDVLFDMRAVTLRVDAVKAKGRQVFTQGGLDELRKMDTARKDKKDGKNGEDEKK